MRRSCWCAGAVAAVAVSAVAAVAVSAVAAVAVSVVAAVSPEVMAAGSAAAVLTGPVPVPVSAQATSIAATSTTQILAGVLAARMVVALAVAITRVVVVATTAGAAITGQVGVAPPPVLRWVPQSALPLPARRTTIRRPPHIARTQITRTVGFERLRRDDTRRALLSRRALPPSLLPRPSPHCYGGLCYSRRAAAPCAADYPTSLGVAIIQRRAMVGGDVEDGPNV
jgi:hypothetical protein